MRKTRTTILGGGAALLLAGTAHAATGEVHRMQVPLGDGSVVQVEYAGDVAPRVTVGPVAAPRLIAFDPFAGFERIAAMMEAQRRSMLMQIAALQQAAARATTAAPGETILVGNLPAGAHYTMVSSTTDSIGCTRTVRYSSDGSGAAPQITRASAGTCDAVQDRPEPLLVNAPAPAAERRAPGVEV